MREPDITVNIHGNAKVTDHPNAIKSDTYPEDRTQRGDEYQLDNGVHRFKIGNKVVEFVVKDP